MSAVMVAVEDVLNMIRPNRYFAAWRERGRVEYAVVEPDETLMALSGMSVRVVDVKARPLNTQPPQDIAQHPRVKQLTETVGYPPALRVFQYTFTPLRLRLVQRLETGAEFYMPTQERDAPPIVIHTVNAYYVVYRSNSGRLYSEVKGGVRAYQLAERGQLKSPQIYFMKLDKHRREIGVRVPLDVEQVRQFISYLTGP
ncbi:MAG: hypothetical protein ACO2PN_08305 [Pyrobaculum sp.]|jgi:hypothetical protein